MNYDPTPQFVIYLYLQAFWNYLRILKYLPLVLLNLNSRKIFSNEISLDLTEREANIIIFLNNSKKPVKISELQTEVWGHNSKLETHTVERHIYRLRKKIINFFISTGSLLTMI